MKRAKTLSALGLLVAGLFAWGQVAIAHDPLHLALKARAADPQPDEPLHIALAIPPDRNPPTH